MTGWPLLNVALVVLALSAGLVILAALAACPRDPAPFECACGGEFDTQTAYLAHSCPQRDGCEPGVEWNYCGWTSNDGLLPCICACTCSDARHCVRDSTRLKAAE